MNTLKLRVNEIVRPLRASDSRKRRIREELLAHLTAMAEEEMIERVEAEEAAQAAISRFGNPRELRAGLQATVPAMERILHFPVPGLGWLEEIGRPRFDRREEEPIVRWAARAALFVWGGGLVGMLVGIAAAWSSRQVGLLRDDTDFKFVEKFAVAGAMLYPLLFALLLTAETAATRLERGRSLRTLCVVGLLAILFDLAVVSQLCLLWMSTGQWQTPDSSAQFFRLAACIAIVAPASCIHFAGCLMAQRRRERYWQA